jgi:lipopolysaccharide/colanic/teichoic acid biosynthesis glycosyltransferase
MRNSSISVAFASVTERLVCAVALLAMSPVLLLAACAIWLEDGRPVLFLQKRLGKSGRTFRLAKLRTMRTGMTGEAVTARGDNRITVVGHVLRKYKLDELPQLGNIVLGHMSLVGPRPEVPAYVDMRNPLWQKVLSVKPGITDIATLTYRNEEEVLAAASDPDYCYRHTVLPAKLSLSAEAIDFRSFRADLRILTYTVLCSFLPARFDCDALSKSISRRRTQ